MIVKIKTKSLLNKLKLNLRKISGESSAIWNDSDNLIINSLKAFKILESFQKPIFYPLKYVYFNEINSQMIHQS